MFMYIGFGIDAVIIFMLFGIYSKLNELLQAVHYLLPEDIAPPETPSEQEP